MTWFQGPIYSIVGAGANQFGIYQRFAVEDLTNYVGQYLTKIKYMVNSSATSAGVTYNTEFSAAPKIQVYLGGSVNGSTYDPGTLIAEVLATDYEDAMDFYNFVELPTPILIDGTQEVWFGVHYSPSQTCYPATSSNGASQALGYIEGKTNIFKSGSTWGSSANFFQNSYYYVWDLAAYTRDAISGDACDITVEMADDYGDGWNHASISFIDSYNNEWNVITCNNDATTVTVTLPATNISCYWNAANYSEEISFTIKDSEGATLYTCETGDFANQSEGVFFSFNNTSCLQDPPQECDPVTNLMVNLDGHDAIITWDAIAEAVEYKVFLDYIEVATTQDPTYTFSGLEDGTSYMVSVTAVYNDNCIPVRADIPFTILTCDPVTSVSVDYTQDCEAEIAWTFDSNQGEMLLWEQMNVGQSNSGWVSQEWSNGNSHIVDDFVIDAPVNVTKLIVQTGATNSINLPATVGIKIWDSNTSGAPNTLLQNITGLVSTGGGVTGTITLDLSENPIALTSAGRYWFTVYGISTQAYSTSNARYLMITGPTLVENAAYIYGSISNTVVGVPNNTWFSLAAQSTMSAVFSVYGEYTGFTPTFSVYRDGNLMASGLTDPSYTDTGFDPYESHEWAVTMSCVNGGESGLTRVVKEPCTLLADDATLYSLTVNHGTLTPVFDPNTINYTVLVGNSIENITINATANHPNATVAGTGQKPLTIGTNPFDIVVTAEDGTTTKTYTVTVTREPSNNATLSSLTVSSGTLTPTFNANTTSYTVEVSSSLENITINATTTHANATVTGTGQKPLSMGSNPFDIVVTAEDGTTTKTYTVTVNRINNDATLASLTVSSGTLTPTFNANTTSYTVAVGNSIENITINATATHPNATIAGTGAKTLNVGANPFDIVVTAEDGTTTKTYTVTVTRAASNDATLSSLTVSTGTLTPVFNTNTISYTVAVSNNVESITINAAATHANATVTGAGEKTLNVGENPFDIVVTAEDGTTTKTYTVTVTRDLSIGEIPADMLLYPNPTSGILHIQTESALLSTIKVYSLQGSLLMEVRDNEVDLSNLVNGIYIVEVEGIQYKIMKK